MPRFAGKRGRSALLAEYWSEPRSGVVFVARFSPEDSRCLTLRMDQ